MSAPDLDRVAEAFGAALAAREAGVSIVDLTKLCDGDAALAAEVRSLLEHTGPTGDTRATADTKVSRGFLDCNELRRDRDHAIGSTLLKEWGSSSIGQRVGPYTLIGELGSGGMAVVFVAEQDKPRRNVALKLVRRSASSDHVLRRFEREAEMHGCLSHPGIAQVYDAGVVQLTDDGGRTVDVPYLAMERVQGVNVADFCRAFGNERDLVLGLVAQMCDAVQHAHQRGVIHRDLKPANVLVTGGARGEASVKVLDFGVARLRTETAERDAETRLTQHGYVLGTLAYMSPEQLGASCDVDTRGDVYALGVILFELLAGHLPVDLTGCGLAEAAVRIRESRPPRLGTVNRAFRGDVETIVAKALEKEPDRRYQSPAELAEDLRHVLAGEPIQARRDSITYTLTRQVVRYRALALAAAAMLVIGIAVAFYVHHEQTLQLRAANAEAEAMRREAVQRKVAEGLATELAARLSASRINEGRLLTASGAWIDAERPLWDEYLAHPDSLDAHWALRELYVRSGCRTTIETNARETRSLAENGRGLMAIGDEDGIVRLWRTGNGTPAGRIDSGLGAVRGACFVGDGTTLALAGPRGACLAGGGPRRPLLTRPAGAVTATPTLLAVGDDDGWLHLFTPAGEPLGRVRAATHAVRAIAIDAAGANLASIHNDGSVRLWRIERTDAAVRLTPGPPVAGHTTVGRTVAFSPDGRTLASGASDQMIRLWRTADGEAITAVRTKNGTSRDVVFAPDGRRIAVAGYWRTQLYDITAAEPYLVRSRGIDGESVTCRFADDGDTLLTLSTAGVGHVWDLHPRGPTVLAGASAASVDEMIVSTNVDGSPLLVTIQADGNVIARSLADGGHWKTVAEWSTNYAVHGSAFDAATGRLWVGRDDGHVLAYDLPTGRIEDNLPALGAAVRTIDLTPDGRKMVVGVGDGRITFWESAGTKWTKAGEDRCGTDVRGATISRDGRTLFTSHRHATLRTWSMDDYRVLGEFARPTASYHPDASPAGAFFAAGDWDRHVHVWNANGIGPAAVPLVTLAGHNQLVNEVVYDDTGTLLASVSTDGQWRVWDARVPEKSGANGPVERECLASRDIDTGEAVTLRFVPGDAGRGLVAVGYRDGTVRVWDMAAGDRYIAGNMDYQRRLRTPATPTVTQRP